MVIGGATPPLPFSHLQAVLAEDRASEPLGPIKPALSVPVAPARASMESVPPRSCRQRQTRHGEWRLSARASVCLGGAGLMGETPAPQYSLPLLPHARGCPRERSWLERRNLGGDRGVSETRKLVTRSSSLWVSSCCSGGGIEFCILNPHPTPARKDARQRGVAGWGPVVHDAKAAANCDRVEQLNRDRIEASAIATRQAAQLATTRERGGTTCAQPSSPACPCGADTARAASASACHSTLRQYTAMTSVSPMPAVQ